MNQVNRNALVGFIFIALGTLFLLDNLDIISWHVRHYLFQWENILILIGAVLVIKKENVKAGGILMGIGILLSLDDWFRLDINIFDLWPIALVLIGFAIISRSKGDQNTEYSERSSGYFDADKVDDTAIFGGGDKVINSMAFKGGMLTAIFGGSNIDLTQSKLAEGRHVIEVLYIFGGSKIRVPQDWKVHVHVTGIFGGMADKRTMIDTNPDSSRELYVKGTAIFGGAEITN